MRAEEVGVTSTEAMRFWMATLTTTLMPFQALVAAWMSSPTFLGEIPRGPH
eukprot:CAMPEP_0116569368 /NCGR_PEP_ID=MMETSP0397-20121206/16266_1 /TAXON_ID=216820 /ORGANISM="Cyclophora tenuis, Strain ECT3854" /LENGTH=50 /DNA_ID=CAMNT_0004096947 /DNA_START=51 /DNA_END=200 /DNA_ORIENTATION=+